MYIMTAITPIYGEYITHFPYIFIIALLTIAALVMLKSPMLLMVQIGLTIVAMLIEQMNLSILSIIGAAIQVGFTLFILYKMKKAAEYNYQLILEKTHEVHRDITRHDYTGTRKSF